MGRPDPELEDRGRIRGPPDLGVTRVSSNRAGQEETDLIGKTLSHYRITGAIKVLPKALASDPDQLAEVHIILGWAQVAGLLP